VLGEAVDDHQVVLGRRLERAGLVTVAEDGDAVHEHLRGTLGDPAMPPAAAAADAAAGLTAELTAYLAEHAGPARPAPA
jgi:UDP-N-acetylglucosamine transferase subunit ALG13